MTASLLWLVLVCAAVEVVPSAADFFMHRDTQYHDVRAQDLNAGQYS